MKAAIASKHGMRGGILHDDDVSMEYATKEAAFEAAVAAAERSLSEGLEIELFVAGGMEGRFV